MQRDAADGDAGRRCAVAVDERPDVGRDPVLGEDARSGEADSRDGARPDGHRARDDERGDRLRGDGVGGEGTGSGDRRVLDVGLDLGRIRGDLLPERRVGVVLSREVRVRQRRPADIFVDLARAVAADDLHTLARGDRRSRGGRQVAGGRRAGVGRAARVEADEVPRDREPDRGAEPAPPTPIPIAAERLATSAEIDAVPDASRSTLVACVTLLPSMKALVFVRTTFCATAPAPATATPAANPPEIATEAATVTASIVARATFRTLLSLVTM